MRDRNQDRAQTSSAMRGALADVITRRAPPLEEANEEGTAHLKAREPLIFDTRAKPGSRRRHAVPAASGGERPEIPAKFRRAAPPALPEVSELQVVRHFTRLSQINFSIDSHFYPLGLLHHEIQPEGVQQLRDAAGISGASSARARAAGIPGLHVRAAGDAAGNHRYAGRQSHPHGRCAGRVRRRRHDPRLSSRARRYGAHGDHRAAGGAWHESRHGGDVRLHREGDSVRRERRHRYRRTESRGRPAAPPASC